MEEEERERERRRAVAISTTIWGPCMKRVCHGALPGTPSSEPQYISPAGTLQSRLKVMHMHSNCP